MFPTPSTTVPSLSTPIISSALPFGSLGSTLMPPPFRRLASEATDSPQRRPVRHALNGGPPVTEAEDRSCFTRKRINGILPLFVTEVVPCPPRKDTPAKPVKPADTEVKMCVTQEYYPPGWHGNRFTEKVTVVQPCKDDSFCTIL